MKTDIEPISLKHFTVLYLAQQPDGCMNTLFTHWEVRQCRHEQCL